MLTVFCLSSGRSGTAFLCGLLRRNARNAVVFHEPYFDPGNPTMFGRPIYDHCVGDLVAIRALLRRKQRRVLRYAPRVYVETSHAFLKCYWDLAPEFFPQMRLVHLVRNPLAVAHREANRESLSPRLHLPFRHYRGGDGRHYFRWSLTGLEPIFHPFDVDRLTLFQRYLLQWIEIENRAMSFLDRFNIRSACFTIHSPNDLNDLTCVARLLQFLDLEPRTDPLVAAGFRNRTPGHRTVIGPKESEECRQVIERLSGETLAIFRREPYVGLEWSRWLMH